jgi:phosphopantothenoylcysteine decarboxylase / phosphopantothenate---cysteine ligase
MSIFAQKHILLGVTGSIAAYKAVDLASKLTQAGAQVDVILTPAAEKFVTPLTFQSVTGRKAFTDADLWGGQAHVLHVGLGHSADLLVIAPCTANTMGKLAHGLADNLLSVTALSAQCPLLIAPAMDVGIYTNAATQDNLRILTDRQVYFAGPAEGRMASGLVGLGRFVEPAELLGHIRLLLGQKGPLAGRKVVVTAGGTAEPLDPVRVLTNRSSGKQGYAVAQAAIDSGAEVVLVTAPTSLTPPVGARVVPAVTAQAMLEAVLLEMAGAAALVMVAAVADFRPKTIADKKIKKRDGLPRLELEVTADILQAVSKLGAGRPRMLVGFAAESQELLENARAKLQAKNVDIMVANDISDPHAGFSVDTNRVTLLFPNAPAEPLPLMGKEEVAETLVARMATFLERQ